MRAWISLLTLSLSKGEGKLANANGRARNKACSRHAPLAPLHPDPYRGHDGPACINAAPGASVCVHPLPAAALRSLTQEPDNGPAA